MQHQDHIQCLISRENIESKVEELSRKICKDYYSKTVTVIMLFNGSFMFAADLLREMSLHVDIETYGLSVSSYSGSESTGKVQFDKSQIPNCKGKDVLIIEDILESGRTLSVIKKEITRECCNSVKICTLLDKPIKRVVDITADYVGFQIPDVFVVGYGLDFSGKCRELPYIGYIKQNTF